MKYFFLILFLSAPTLAETITLIQGEKKSFSGFQHAIVENRKVISLEESNKGFLIKAIGPGSSQLKLDSQLFEINVLSLAQEKSFKLLRQILPQTLGLRAQTRGDSIVIGGELLRWKDWRTLFDNCIEMNCHYLFQPKIKSEISSYIQEQVYLLLASYGIHQPNINFTNGVRIFITKEDESFKERAKVYAALGLQVIKNSQAVDISPLVKVQITVAEIKREQALSYGIKWPAQIGASVVPAQLINDEPFEVFLQAMESHGLGKILASPNILCKSGTNAEFFAGGEFPIKILNFKISDVVWKKYGVSLKVSPVADANGRMSIAIETEVSSLDKYFKVDGIPALHTNKLQSHFDLTEPRTIALSGLIKSEESEAAAGIPALMHIPILGNLFASKDFQESRTELVIFVRPEIINTFTH